MIIIGYRKKTWILQTNVHIKSENYNFINIQKVFNVSDSISFIIIANFKTLKASFIQKKKKT